MDPSEARLERERCSLHPDRGAVGICERCSRTLCLECAVAFRGAVRCERCAARELGDPEPTAPQRRRPIRPEHVALALLLVGLAATLPPWHRSGTLTSGLSAWSLTLDGWAALGCACLALAAIVVVLGLLKPVMRRRLSTAALLLSGAACLAIAIALLRAPTFFSSTPAPFLAAAGAMGGGVAAAFSLVRAPHP